MVSNLGGFINGEYVFYNKYSQVKSDSFTGTDPTNMKQFQYPCMNGIWGLNDTHTFFKRTETAITHVNTETKNGSGANITTSNFTFQIGDVFVVAIAWDDMTGFDSPFVGTWDIEHQSFGSIILSGIMTTADTDSFTFSKLFSSPYALVISQYRNVSSYYTRIVSTPTPTEYPSIENEYLGGAVYAYAGAGGTSMSFPTLTGLTIRGEPTRNDNKAGIADYITSTSPETYPSFDIGGNPAIMVQIQFQI